MIGKILVIVGTGIVGLASWSAVSGQPVNAEREPLRVEIVYNQQTLSVETEERTVGGVVVANLGGGESLVIDPDPTTPVSAGMQIFVWDTAAKPLDATVAENLTIATAPPAEPEPVAVPAPKPAVKPTPAPTPEAPAIDKEPDKTYSGLATWYRHGTEMTTASRDFPRGTRLRVIATNSGKTVDVAVNDYGPSLSTGISLDLNAPAFAALAPLGAGKIPIKYYRID